MQLLRWWFVACLSVFAVVVLGAVGYLENVWQNDVTKLTFVIILLYLITTALLGWRIKTRNYTESRFGMYMYELLPILGLIGTVIGFIYMFSQGLLDLDVTQPDTVRDGLKTLAVGISTALYTTLAGMICSELVKLQMKIVVSGRQDVSEQM